MHLRSRRAALPAILAIGLALAAIAPAAAAGPTVRRLASNLDNPRGVTVGLNGWVYVAQAGRGGSNAGYGATGKITRFRSGERQTWRSGLPSVISEEGASGPHGVAQLPDGRVFTVVGGGPENLNTQFGEVLRVRPGLTVRIADIATYQDTHPDTTDLDMPPNPTDSNPYGLARVGNRLLVTDAGGNELLIVNPATRGIRTVAKFPNAGAEAVPTTVAVGPDGYWYVGELKGFPFTPGASRIWRIAPWARDVTCDPAATASQACHLFATGFTSIVSMAFGPDGSLYVIEMVKNGVLGYFTGTDTVGALWKLRRGVKTEILPGRFTLPGGVAVSRSGNIYVTNKSVSVGTGELLRITP